MGAQKVETDGIGILIMCEHVMIRVQQFRDGMGLSSVENSGECGSTVRDAGWMDGSVSGGHETTTTTTVVLDDAAKFAMSVQHGDGHTRAGYAVFRQCGETF